MTGTQSKTFKQLLWQRAIIHMVTAFADESQMVSSPTMNLRRGNYDYPGRANCDIGYPSDYEYQSIKTPSAAPRPTMRPAMHVDRLKRLFGVAITGSRHRGWRRPACG